MSVHASYNSRTAKLLDREDFWIDLLYNDYPTPSCYFFLHWKQSNNMNNCNKIKCNKKGWGTIYPRHKFAPPFGTDWMIWVMSRDELSHLRNLWRFELGRVTLRVSLTCLCSFIVFDKFVAIRGRPNGTKSPRGQNSPRLIYRLLQKIQKTHNFLNPAN